jgi:F-type H+-transporting ATPase subunit a
MDPDETRALIFIERIFADMKSFFLILFFLFSATDVFAVPFRTPVEEKHQEDPLMHHLADHPYVEFPGIKILLPRFQPVKLGPVELDLSLTNHFVFFWIGIGIMLIALRRFKKGKLVQTSLMGQLVESVVLFVRDDIIRPVMPANDVNRFLPFFLTLFFFILIENIMGLFPYLSQCTKNLSVTSALAVIVFVVWQYAALKRHGVVGYMRTMMPISRGEMPLPAVIGMNLFLFPLEFVQIFAKPFALSIRLFANMVAGHAVILSFMLLGWGGSAVGWQFHSAVPGLFGASCIYLLEVLVAFIQAYVFVLLSAIFIGTALQEEH